MHRIFFVGLLFSTHLVPAVPAQDSATIARLTQQHAGASRLRVSGTFGQRDIPFARIDSGGVRYRTMPPLDSMGLAAPRHEVLAWSDIHRIERRGSSAGRGALIGAGVATGIALASIVTSSCSGEEEWLCGIKYAVSILLIPVGTGVGALIGWPIKRWKTVYRAPGR